MRLIGDLSHDIKKMLTRIYKKSKHHQTRERAKCLLLSFEGKRMSELMEALVQPDCKESLKALAGKLFGHFIAKTLKSLWCKPFESFLN